MTIVFASDFDLRGSGYMNISVSLCTQLANHGYDVIALGLGYKRQEHNYPFKIIPAQLHEIVPMISNLKASEVDIETLIVALDIPLQAQLLKQLNAPNEELPYIGIFPIEAGPLCTTWAMDLLRMDSRLIMSKFGQEELAKKGVDSTFIPIGIDTNAWRMPTANEYVQLRQGLDVEDGTTVVLTVADNQERKNLSRSMEIFADFAQKHKAVYWLVTRPNSPVGWRLEDYAIDLGIMDKIFIWQRGMPQKNLWSLFAAADVFLLTSKAEGLAMPALEAMSMRLPVVGTECAAIEEHLSDGRGYLIKPDYVMLDPFGNSHRYFASRNDGVYRLEQWLTADEAENTAILDRAQAYVKSRTWDKAGNILIKMIGEIKAEKQSPIINIAELEKVAA
jgi:glycosyltransferase involved in cell wall biosynthesis